MTVNITDKHNKSKVVRETGSAAQDPKLRAKVLGLYGLLARWDEVREEPWLQELFSIEEEERKRRSLERRIRNARIGSFKPMTDFEWDWPTRIDREAIDELFALEFLEEGGNVILLGANGLGKTMIAQNLAYDAVLRGETVRFTTASEMLNDLGMPETTTSLNRRMRKYCHPRLLAIDEVGYLSYGTRHADLLFEVVNRRHGKSTIVTTNKAFREWNEVFPNSASVVALIDRLVHRAEVVLIEGESYRKKEAEERAARKALERGKRAGARKRKEK
jgi:DNA replication protein DnaC